MYNVIIKFNNSFFLNSVREITGACDSNKETGDPKNLALFPS